MSEFTAAIASSIREFKKTLKNEKKCGEEEFYKILQKKIDIKAQDIKKISKSTFFYSSFLY